MAAQKESQASSRNNNTSTRNQSPSNSQGSSTHPCLSPPLPLPPKEEGVVEEDLTATLMDSSNPNPNRPANSHDFFTSEEIAKYDKYEADFAHYLRAKYFSDKDVYGGNIFDVAVKVGNETIKASRSSPTRSFADPTKSFSGPSNVMDSGEDIPSASGVVEASPKFPNGSATPVKKSN